MKPMKRGVILCGVVLMLAAVSAYPQKAQPMINTSVGLGDAVITHVANGGGWKTTITVVNLSLSKASLFVLYFYGDDGLPIFFPFVGLGRQAYLMGTLAPAGSAIFKTDGTGTANQGWGYFDFETSGNVSGFAVFSNTNGNEAAVPFESDRTNKQLLSFDNTSGFGMGVALVNSSSVSAMTITATFYDENGIQLGTDSFLMSPLNHSAFIFSSRWPFTANRRGTVFLEPDNIGLAILGLRFTPAGAFTSVASFHESDLVVSTFNPDDPLHGADVKVVGYES